MGNATPLNRLKAWLSTWWQIQFVRDIPLYFDRRETYSQHGEDSFLVEHVFSGKNTGFYVDIGASHPIRWSNTYALYRRGWSGIIVEPIHNLVEVHKRWRPHDVQVECLLGDTDDSASFYRMYPSTRSTTSQEDCENALKWARAVLISSRTLPQLTLKTLFEKYIGSRSVDFMSVDIEGRDQFMASQIRLLPREAMPQCLCIECNTEEAEQNIIKSLGDIYKTRKKIGCNLVFWEVA
jgi:hypothetical protein